MSSTLATDPSQMPVGDELSLPLTTAQDADASASFHKLNAARCGVKQRLIYDDRPTLPSAVNLPGESHAQVLALVTHGDRMIRIVRDDLNNIAVRWSSLHRHERVNWQRFNLPADLCEIDVLVISEEGSIACVVVDPLLDDIGRPAQVGDHVLSLELCEAVTALATSLRQISEINKAHTDILLNPLASSRSLAKQATRVYLSYRQNGCHCQCRMLTRIPPSSFAGPKELTLLRLCNALSSSSVPSRSFKRGRWCPVLVRGS